MNSKRCVASGVRKEGMIFHEEENVPCRIIGAGNAGCAAVDRLVAEAFKADCCVMVNGSLEKWRESERPAEIALTDFKPTRGLDWDNEFNRCNSVRLAPSCSCLESVAATDFHASLESG